jgi:hypothetical protein
MRRNAICSGLEMLLAVAGALVTTATTLLAQAPAVQIRIYDYADLKQGSMDRIVALTQKTLADAGVSVQVKICTGDLAACYGDCAGSIRRIAIRLVSGRAKTTGNADRPILGMAFAGPEGGTFTSVFLARVQDVAAETHVPWEILAAYAAVHETGHLLLGPGAHTTRGLMKANWDLKDCQAMYAKRFRFSDDQAHQLKARYGGLPSGSLESCSGTYI